MTASYRLWQCLLVDLQSLTRNSTLAFLGCVETRVFQSGKLWPPASMRLVKACCKHTRFHYILTHIFDLWSVQFWQFIISECLVLNSIDLINQICHIFSTLVYMLEQQLMLNYMLIAGIRCMYECMTYISERVVIAMYVYYL